MALFDVDSNRVALESDGIPVLYAETYEISMSILQQPAAFSLRLGAAVPVHELADLWVPNTPFRLSIGGAPQFSGRSDGYTLSATNDGGSATIRGRDALAPLHDGFASTEKALANLSFREIVEAGMLDAFGAPNVPTLISSNEANRKVITAAPVAQSAPPKIDGVDSDVLVDKPAPGRKLQLKIGQRWLSDVIKPELDRAGLFLWCAGNGDIVLSAPNTSQSPTFRIFRKFGSSNYLTGELRNEPTARYSRCDVHCRAGGGDKARTKPFGTYEDKEMVAWGINRPMCIADSKAKTIEQAELLARRKIVEARRAAWSLTYTIAGHTLPNLYNGAPAVVAPDVVFSVEDEELGISGAFWCEAVEHRGSPQKTTTIHLMRVEDVVFGGDPE